MKEVGGNSASFRLKPLPVYYRERLGATCTLCRVGGKILTRATHSLFVPQQYVLTVVVTTAVIIQLHLLTVIN